MAEWKAIRIANPRRKTKAAKRKVRRWKSPNRRRLNPGPAGGVLTLMANPKKKRRRNAWFKEAKARRRPNPFVKSAKRRRRRNPMWMKVRNRHHARRRNPFTVAGKSPMSMAKLTVGALGGAIGTRSITNLVLRQKNAGLLGYGVNVAIALALGYLGGKFSEDVGLGLMVGGLGSTAQRIWDDKVSGVLPAAAAVVQASAASVGASVPAKSLGDVSYSDDGLGRALLGEYVSASFPTDKINGPYLAAGSAPAPAPTGTAGKGSHLSGAAW
jgi:hypothetical protein